MKRISQLLIALWCFSTLSYVNAQDDDDESPVETVDNTHKAKVKLDFNAQLEKSATPKILISQINPARGPMTGETRVTVRGGPFSIWETAYPNPKCKFGDVLVSASYTLGSQAQFDIKAIEKRKGRDEYIFLSCDFSPEYHKEGSVQFQISLIGDFSDSLNSVEFYYYPTIGINKIKPMYGPKDGDTLVQVWGENFRSFNQTTLCSFGTKTVPAYIINDTYLECTSPFSDVVAKAIPFAITQNHQQFSRDTKTYYYYNDPQVYQFEPPRGPESGGYPIVVLGHNFHPFKEILSEVDNAPDVFCAFRELNLKVPAKVLNSTRVECVSPPSYYWHQTRIEVTLNDQQYTSDDVIFYYYKPPNLYDLDPREGPLQGNTAVTVSGTNFEDTGDDIHCKFDNKTVPGKYLNPQQILCIAPPGSKPGFVPLVIELKPNMWSTPLKYLYYETPILGTISPTCGPDFGYTQIEVTGQNFIDLGRNKAMCVFNKTIFTNATIFSDSLLYCDSPPFLNSQGYSMIGSNGEKGDFYQLQLTIDGGVEVAGTPIKFWYYVQPKMMGIQPYGGPIRGNTPVTLNVTGLLQQKECFCNMKVRFSTFELDPKVLNGDQMQITAPVVGHPGTVVVQLAYNGQQFTDERIIHLKDPHASYEYYTEPIITFHHPNSGPSTGGTLVTVHGFGFANNKQQEYADPKNPQAPNKMWVRFIDPKTRQPLEEPREIPKEDFREDEIIFKTVPMPPLTQALLQISRNRMDWTDVKNPNPEVFHSFMYYAAPHVTKLSPSFGPVKPENDTYLTIQGSDFICPNSNCQNTKVRFKDSDGYEIFTSNTVLNDHTISALIPKYTKPDVLIVEVAMNGVDFTNDNKTYGYYDPYLIDAIPRLINVNGTTVVTVIGLGFVDSGEVKTKFSNSTSPLICSSVTSCSQDAKFIDATKILSATLPQNQMNYKQSGENIQWDPYAISVSVYSDQYTDNKVYLYYYHEPNYTLLSTNESPANIPNQLVINTEINPNDLNKILKYGKPQCRFVDSNNHVMFTDAILVHSVQATNGTISNKVNSLKCMTPAWTYGPAKVKLSFTVNGFDFAGETDFTFGDELILHRIVPMAGPVELSTKASRLLGSGFVAKNPQLEYNSKWGVLETYKISRNFVYQYKYYFADWLNIIPGNEELKCYWYEAASMSRVDTELHDGMEYNTYKQASPQIKNKVVNGLSYKTNEGGPFYVEVGRNIPFNNSRSVKVEGLVGETYQSESYTYYEFQYSSVEFYHYKQCSMLQMHPSHGLTRGGTAVQVIGLDFRYWPEYGVVPHCKFGDQIVRGYFDSTVRIVCESPPNEDALINLNFEVSLNGEDWTGTGFTYSYFREPELISYWPDSGQTSGSTTIYVKGKNFPKMINNRDFHARFTPQTAKMAAKIMPVEWLNDTMVKVITPGGWSQGDKMNFQLTFNGQDYDQNNFTFIFYNIASVRPRSGPSDGAGGDIIISGQGFRPDSKPLCRLNGTIYPPVSFTWTEIRCPMPPAEDGPQFFGNVDLAVSANNGAEWHVFNGGFQYYQQPTVDDISPKTGPAHGVGVINFYGSNFRSDYQLAELSCKIGNNVGQAVFVSKNQIRCVVEDMEDVTEGQRLPAQIALNGYSWTATNDHPDETGSTFFVPYSVKSIFPNSGRMTGGSEIIIIGSGFVENELNQPRCRFGVSNNYAITQAQIISFNKLVCISPPMPIIKHPEALPIEMPFSVALTQDNFEPWTQTHHRFRYYKSPIIDQIIPSEIQVGLITEVLATIDPSTFPDNTFFEPFPAEAGKFDMSNDENEASEIATALLMGNQIKCRFGRFGETLAVFINETAIKCVTPAVSDEPEDIYRESVEFSIAMNGYDYDYDANSHEFTFIGTGSYMGLGPIILCILLGGVLLVAFIIFVQAYFLSLQGNQQNNRAGPNVQSDGVNPVPRGQVYPQFDSQSRASRGGDSRAGN